MKDDLLRVNFDYLQAVRYGLYQNHVSISDSCRFVGYNCLGEDFAEIIMFDKDNKYGTV